MNREKQLRVTGARVVRYDIDEGTRYARIRRLSPMVSSLIICAIIGTVASLSAVYMTDYTTNGTVHFTGNRMKPQSKNNPPRRSASSPPVTKSAVVAASLLPSNVQAGPTTTAIAAAAWTKVPLFTEPGNTAVTYAMDNLAEPGADLIKRQGMTPVAHWFGDWDKDPTAAVNRYVAAATNAGSVPMLVLYNIPKRDCGLYSAGGVADIAAYAGWINNVAAGIGIRQALVILEPDALAGNDCLSAADRNARYEALSRAVSVLKANPRTTVYVDAGNPAWQTVGVMANRLKLANIAQADGFSLNVANFVSTARNQAYGDQLSKQVGGKHYVIDTSRNGINNLDPDSWCNNHSAALGSSPTVQTGAPLNDGLLWIKIPWESDGTCNRGPTAGAPYWSFAIQLAKNAGW